MTTKLKFLVTGLMFASAIAAAPSPTRAVDDSKFEIVKATDTRVWRLNKETGEIAVCTLEGENLFCTTTSAAVDAPQLTYEEWEAKKKLKQAKADEDRKVERGKNLAFFDKMIDLFRSFVQRESQ